MAKLKKAFKQPVENIKVVTKSDAFIKTLIFIGLLVALFTIFGVGAAPQKYNLVVGEIATEDIYAPNDIVDKVTTEQRMLEADRSVQPIYKHDLNVQIELTEKIESFFDLLITAKNSEDLNLEQKINYLEQQSNINLSRDKYLLLIRAKNSELDKLKINISYIINQILGQRITEDQLEEKRETIRSFFSKITEESSLNVVGSDIAVMVIRPNMFYDEENTLAKKAEARSNVEDVIIKRGTRIVNKGQEITPQQIKLVEAYGLLSNGADRFNLRIYIGYIIIILTGLLMIWLYLYKFDKKIWNNNSNILLISIIMIIFLAISITIRAISDYLIILPAFVMIISIMLNPRIALLTNIIMTVYIGYITGFDNGVITIMLLTGILGSIMVYKTYHRSTIVYAGICIGLTSVMLILSFGLLHQIDLKGLLIGSIYGLVGGVLSAVLTIGILPFLEATFDILTPIKLLELSNPNQPLLRRLLIEAPGTYYHSILVGNLSEAAAEEVGANSLLCRIGAYYHDIGKLKRPYFFKENQITKDNPHDKIAPNLSALIITSHVTDGIEMAKKYKLPSLVISIIRQHHGNTLVAYFYHKALNLDGGEQVTEDKFRYQFSKPQTKEAAIVMLADSAEAYIRSLTEPTQEQVELGVKKIIRDKLQDGQLEQCDLTLKDLDNIGRAFVKVLAGIFHERIEYPETPKDIYASTDKEYK